MEYVVSIVFIVIGFALLVKGADLFVDNASGVARKIGISPLVVGLTVVAFGTSMPELAVSVTAALEGHNEIAVGNVVGSNIFNLLVVAGLSACLFPLVTNKTIMKRDWPISTVAALLLAAFLWPNMHIARWEAVVLFAVACLTISYFGGYYLIITTIGHHSTLLREMAVVLLFLKILTTRYNKKEKRLLKGSV